MRILLATALVVAALPMVAQATNTTTGQVAAQVLPIAASVQHSSSAYLNFGVITSTGIVQSIPEPASGPVGTVSGAGCDSFSYTVDPFETVSVTLGTVAPLLNVGTVALNPVPNITATNSTSAANTGTFNVGGTLTTVAWPAKGTYSATYTVTLTNL